MSNIPWRNDKWYTSFWNFDEKVKDFYKFSKNIKFHDVCLRDGEQQPGLLFNKDQKIAIAEKLAEVGIQRIEAGMPVVSKQDEDAIREIAKRNLGPEIFTFARCMVQDAQLAIDLGASGIIMEIPANELLIKHGYKWDTQKAIDAAVAATKYASDHGLYVVLFLIDFSRADFEYSTRFIDAVNKDGYFDALACVDTMGVLNPLGAYRMVEVMKEKYKGKKIEFHGHDDFGLGSANTVMALAAGADVVHTTISAIGERAGNVAYEDVAMSLLTMFGVDTGLNYEKIYPTSRFLLDLAGIECRPNKGIVGPDISKMAAGLVVGWYENIKNVDPLILFPYRFPMTGHPDVSYVIGKHSGIPTIVYYLKQIGLPYEDKELNQKIVNAVKEKAYDKGTILNIDEFAVIAKSIVKGENASKEN